MRIAVISDLHGNMDAVERVWDTLHDVDRIICLGDMIGIGPHPRKVLERAMDEPRLTWVMGNHELNTRDGTELGPLEEIQRKPHHDWVRGDIGDMVNELEAPFFIRERIGKRSAVLMHRHPEDCFSKVPYFDRPFPSVMDEFYSDVDADMFFFGHTHVPLYLRGEQGRTYINPGSIGAENGGISTYVVIDDDRSVISMRTVPYDREKVISDLKRKEVPYHPFIARHFFSSGGFVPFTVKDI